MINDQNINVMSYPLENIIAEKFETTLDRGEFNTRMRDLQKTGYEIIRFSGTEIWHRPYKCAEEILNIILSKCQYAKEEKHNGKEKNVVS